MVLSRYSAEELDWYRSGSTEPWTAELVATILKASGKHRVLELGSYLGLTSRVLLRTLEGTLGSLTVLDVDPDRMAAAKGLLESMRSKVPITYVVDDALVYLKSLPPRSFDFVFVDDDHSTNHVAKELDLLVCPTNRVNAVVAPDGIVCMHDVVGSFHLDEVCRRYHGYVLNLPRLHAGGGLGIIQLPG